MGRKKDGKCQPGHADVHDRRRSTGSGSRRWRGNYNMTETWEAAQRNGDMRPFQKTIMGWWWTPTRPDQVGVNFTHVIHVDSTRAEDLTRATMEARDQCYETIAVYRKYVPGMEKCHMVSTPNTIGIRESRRILGEYLITEDDVRDQRGFDDAICYGSFFVDIHCVDGPGMDPTVWHPPAGFKYQIPYRALTPRKIDSLLVAGRCVSCTHIALGSIRVMVPCLAMGEGRGSGRGSVDQGRSHSPESRRQQRPTDPAGARRHPLRGRHTEISPLKKRRHAHLPSSQSLMAATNAGAIDRIL